MLCRIDLFPTDKQLAEAKIERHKKRVRAQTADLAEATAEVLSAFPSCVNELAFHPVRRWRFDHAWPTHMIAVEIHGGVHSGGHHVSADGFINDRHKMNEAVLMGWHVIEVTTDDVRNGNLEEWLTQAFERWGSLNVEGAQCD
ncbi:hypothetical protein [Aeromonas caviae]|uniref:hypothetical protein n=1 Tax=Aeromonas TaxID=642 RepID=UPI00388E258D